MSSVDNRVVSLTFDNNQFQAAMAQTMRSIDQLTANIEKFNANNGFAGLQQQANAVNLANISDQVDRVSSRFGAMGAVAFSVIQRITNSAMDMGKSLLDNLVQPLVEGGRNRALQIEQAKFLFRGLGMDVQKTMDSALDAVRGTAYGLGDAATLAGVFGAAGVDAGEQMTGALRGVAGVAAITGRNFGEIGAVFQNIASLNRVYTNDLNSLALRGLGIGKIAEAMHMSVEELRAAATDGSIDFKTFATAMNEAFGDHAVEANQTYTGSLANLRAAISRIGADVFTARFEALRVIFNALAPAIDKVHEALMPLIRAFAWISITGAHQLANFIDGLNFDRLRDTFSHLPRIFTNIVNAIKAIVRPIAKAFRDIFPAEGVNQLQLVAMAIQRFTQNLKISGSTAHQVRNIFRGVFSVLSIGWSILKGVVTVLASFVGALTGGESGALKFAGGLGKMLMHLQDILVNGGAIQDFFDNVAEKVANFVNAIKDSGPIQAFTDVLTTLGSTLGGLFTDTDADLGNIEASFGRVSDRIDSLNNHGSNLAHIWDSLKNGLENVVDWIMKGVDRIKEALLGIWDSLKESFSEGNFSEIADLVNVGIIGAITGIIWQVTHNGLNINLMSSFVFKLKLLLGQLGITLKALQMEVRARALVKIAEAVAILAASMVALSLIDSAALTKALAAMTVGMTQLVLALAAINGVVASPSDVAKLDFLGVALMSLSVSLLIFSAAVGVFGTMDTDTIIRGLLGIFGALVVITAAAYMTKDLSPSLAALGFALMPLAVGLGMVGSAIAIFGLIDPGTVAESLLEMAASLTVFGVAAWLLEGVIPQIAALGVALIPLSIGLGAVAAALAIYSLMDTGVVAESLLKIAASLAVLGVAAFLLEPVIPLMSELGFALIPLAIGLGAIAAVLAIFNAIGLEGVATGLLGVGASLMILGASAALLQFVLPMMFDLGVVLVPLSVGLMAMAVAIGMFAAISFGDLLMGLLGIALSFTVLGVAASALSEAIPFIAAFGAALLLVAGAFALFGAGSYLLAEAFRITAEGLRELAALGPEAWDALVHGAEGAVTIIPDLLEQLAEGILAFLETLLRGLPPVLELLWDIIAAWLDQIPRMAPKIAEAIGSIIVALSGVINEHSEELIAAGMELLINLLNGIKNNIDQITTLVAEIIIRFTNALTDKMPGIVSAGALLLISFLQGIAMYMNQIVAAGINIIVSFLNGIANNIGRVVTAGTNIIVNFLNGIANNIGRIIDAGVKIIIKFLEGIRSAAGRITKAAFDLIVGLVNDLSSAIDQHSEELRSAGLRLGWAIINGISAGMLERAANAVATAADVAGRILQRIEDTIIPGSPSKVTTKYGQQIAEGLALGMSRNTSAVREAKTLSDNVIGQFKKITDELVSGLTGIDEFNPVITPVLDLTGVSKDARGISSLLGSSPITASLSTARAQSISSDTTKKATAAQDVVVDTGPKEITFQQINYARDELTLDELYVQTRSQIALAKRELGIS